MGGVVSAIDNALGSVGDAIGHIDSEIVHAVEGAGKAVGKTLEKVGQTAANDPIGTIAKVAAVCTGQLYLLPVISAVDVLAHGGDLGQAALSAGISYVGMGIASGVSDMLASGAESTLTDVATNDAGNTVYSYSDGSSMTSYADGSTSTFTDPTTITGPLNAAISNGAANAATNLAVTGDISKSLTAGLTAAAGTYVGGEVAGLTDSKLAGTIAGGLTKGAITGKDPTANIVNNIISTSLSQAGSQIKSAWNDVNTTVDQYNKQQADAQDLLKNTVTPAQQDAQAAQDAAKASYDAYTTQSNKFADLVKQVDDAKAAGNTDLANSLADQANAMIPDLNAATDKYNADATTYQAKLDTFNSVNAKLTDASTQLDATKADYTAKNDALTKESAALTDAATKVAAMSPDAQKSFATLYGNGSSVADALDTTTKVNSMDPIAQSAFTRNLNTSNDPTAALDIANQVNSLATPDKTAYQTAVTNGFNDTQALSIAPQISSYDTTQQGTYLKALQSGDTAQGADFMTALKTLGSDTLDAVVPSAQAETVPPADNSKASVTVTNAPASFDANSPAIPIPADPSAPADGTTPAPADGTTPAPADGTTPAPSTTPSTGSIDLGQIFKAISGGSGVTPASTTSPKVTTPAVTTPAITNLTPTGTNLASSTTPAITNSGITNLTPGLTKNVDYTLTGEPVIQETLNPMDQIPKFSSGSSVNSTGITDLTAAYDPYTAGSSGADTSSNIYKALAPGLTKSQISYILTGLPPVQGHAEGGEIDGEEEEHNATFFSPGGLANTYVQGDGDGTSDSVKAMLANGEFVIPADVVSDLGNGSNEAGASVLDQFLKSIRAHKQSNGVKLPPDSKGPLAYLTDATRKVKA